MLSSIPRNALISDLGTVIRCAAALPLSGYYVGTYKFGFCNILEWNRNFNSDEEGWYCDSSNLVVKVAKTHLQSYDYNGFVQFFADTGAYVLYCLATPITTPLSAEEIAAYRALTTYPGTTVVSTAEPVAGIEARYILDGTAAWNKVTTALSAMNKIYASYEDLSGAIREGVNTTTE